VSSSSLQMTTEHVIVCDGAVSPLPLKTRKEKDVLSPSELLGSALRVSEKHESLMTAMDVSPCVTSQFCRYREMSVTPWMFHPTVTGKVAPSTKLAPSPLFRVMKKAWLRVEAPEKLSVMEASSKS